MAKLNLVSPIVEAIEHKMIFQEPRKYMGYSGIGGDCARATWYSFRICKDRYIEPRIQRLFNRGKYEESVITLDLLNAGMTVEDVEFEVVGLERHIKGHIDGTVTGVPGAEKTKHLLEMKTMKASKFKEYQKVGLKKFSSAYWHQIHSYMGKLNLKRCLYVVTNKDTEERDYQRIVYDHQAYLHAENLAFHILSTEEAPAKIGDKTWFVCKFCDYKDICHSNKKVNDNCRTCKHGCIEPNGAWSCDNNKTDFKWLTFERQKSGCDKHKYLDTFLKEINK